jgi:hypothetical protein
MRHLLLLTGLLVLPGCVHVSFVPTVPDYTPHQADVVPPVFVDRLPPRPYESVGIIEISGGNGELGHVMEVAADKGKELGCDVVVDRAIHRVSSAHLPRWSATASPRLALLVPAPVATSNVVMINSAPPPPPVMYPVPSTPSFSHEFICGVYLAAAPPPPVQGPPVAPGPPPPGVPASPNGE